MWEPFANWVAAEHPDDVSKMYEERPDRVADHRGVDPALGAAPREYVEAQTVGGLHRAAPEGATPSTPGRGELVVRHWWGVARGSYVYADGRLIWYCDTATRRSTGYLEQRLTPEGVELVRSDVVSSGLFVEDLDVNVGGGGPCVSWISVRDGDRARPCLLLPAAGAHHRQPRRRIRLSLSGCSMRG